LVDLEVICKDLISFNKNRHLNIKTLIKGNNLFTLISNISLSIIFQILGKLLGFLFAWLSIRHYGADIWGQIVFALSIMMIIKNIGQYGLHSALLKVVPESLLDNRIERVVYLYKRTVVFVMILIVLLVSIVQYFRPFILNNFLTNSSGLDNVLIYILWSTPFMALNVINSHIVQGFKKFGLSSFIIHTLNYLILSVALLSVMFLNNSLSLSKAYLFSTILSASISTILVFYTIYRYKKNISTPLLGEDKTGFKYLFNIASPLFISSFSFLALNWSDSLIIGYYCPDEKIAVFNIVVKYAAIIIIGLTAVNTVVAPQFSEYWGSGNIEKLRNLAKKATFLSVVLSFPLILVFLLFPNFLLNLYGEEFVSGELSLRILTLGYVPNIFCGSVGFILMMTDRQKIYRNILLISVIINIVMELILVPHYDILGAAIANAVGMSVWNISSAIYIYKRFDFWPGFDPRFLTNLLLKRG